MAGQETSYDAIVRVEILDQARAIVTALVYELEDTDPGAAEALRHRRRDLTEPQQGIRVAGPTWSKTSSRSGDRARRTRSASGRSSDHAEKLASRPLSPERNDSIFRNDILPDYLPEAMRRVDRPRLILLGGQPGAGKMAVLIASHAELEQSGPTMNTEPMLRRELENVTRAISKPLSPVEKTDLKAGNVAKLSSSLGISREQGASLRLVHEPAKALRDAALRQNRDRARGSQIDIRR